MDRSRVYMLASDHRWQWEEWCDAAGIPRPRIAEVKRLVLDAFLDARSRSEDVKRYGALLLDSIYGADPVREARAAGIAVGTPVEKAGKFPLEWQNDPFHAGLEGNTFAKVLVRYRPEWDRAAKHAQMEKLLAFQDWCRAAGMVVVVEVLIMRMDEDEQQFEAIGRPRLLASMIRESYRKGMVPDLWKIEGTTSAEGARMIDEAIREQAGPRRLILGKGADAAQVGAWFAASAALPSTAGFAIGRTVFWDAGKSYLRGTREAGDVVTDMSTRYLGLIEEWKRHTRPS